MSESETSVTPSGPVRNIWVTVLQVLSLVCAFYILEQDVEAQLFIMNRLPNVAGLDADFTDAPDFGQGYVSVTKLGPRSPLPAQGVSAGDHIRFDFLPDSARLMSTGEPVGFTLDHLGHRSHHVVAAVPGRPQRGLVSPDTALNLADMMSVLLAIFILIRAKGRPATVALGVAMVGFGLTYFVPLSWESGRSVFAAAAVLNYAIGTLEAIFFVMFAMLYYRDSGGTVQRGAWWGLGAYALALLALNEWDTWGRFMLADRPHLGNDFRLAFELDSLLYYAGFAVTFAYLVAGWRRSTPAMRQRYSLLLIAISAVIAAQSLGLLLEILVPAGGILSNPYLSLIYGLLSGVVAPVLFTYAILRHRVLDVGFAVNRTLVYGALSFVILLAFGLAEWGIEKVLPPQYAEANAFAGAGIALVIFLVFHRVRDFVEHHIEKLFFHQWHEKEAALKRFVREAGFILKRDHLTAAFIAALREFAEGAEAALYLISDDGAYRRTEGRLSGVPETIDADDAFMVTLRTDRTAFEPASASAAIALVLPMIHRTEVVGVVLMGRKPSDFSYRPDERDVLASAAHQIGLDLHALKVEALEARVTELTGEVKTLRSVVAVTAATT